MGPPAAGGTWRTRKGRLHGAARGPPCCGDGSRESRGLRPGPHPMLTSHRSGAFFPSPAHTDRPAASGPGPAAATRHAPSRTCPWLLRTHSRATHRGARALIAGASWENDTRRNPVVSELRPRGRSPTLTRRPAPRIRPKPPTPRARLEAPAPQPRASHAAACSRFAPVPVLQLGPWRAIRKAFWNVLES